MAGVVPLDALRQNAIDALDARIGQLLSEIPEPKPEVVVNPLRITPVGLGGLVALDEAGPIYGCRIEAEVMITAQAGDWAGLPAVVTAVTRAMVGPARQTLLAAGILEMRLEELRPKPAKAEGQAPERDLIFQVLFEFTEKSAPGTETIDQLVVNIQKPGNETIETIETFTIQARPK